MKDLPYLTAVLLSGVVALSVYIGLLWREADMPDYLWGKVADFLARPRVTAWLISRAIRTPYLHLTSADGTDVYMERYWLFNAYRRSDNKPKHWWCPWSVRLHWIRREDRDRAHHDHPWNARTIILRGGYVEKRLVPLKTGQHLPFKPVVVLDNGTYAIEQTFNRSPGDTATLGFGEYHTITAVHPDGVWTLFISGPWRGVWGFLVDGIKVPWKKYLGIAEGEDLKPAELKLKQSGLYGNLKNIKATTLSKAEPWDGEADLSSLEPFDFNKEVILDPPSGEGCIGYARPVTVSFDGAEGQGRVWLCDDDDNMVAIEGWDNCEKAAKLLMRWADATRPGGTGGDL